MDISNFILFSGGARGTETAFGECAEEKGVEEVNFSFEGHVIERSRGLRVLNHEELIRGDFSLEYLSKLMNRRYSDSSNFRKLLQSIWYQINNGQEIFVVGEILADGTVKGGTGWGAEFAKLCNKPLHAYDQKKRRWFRWKQSEWSACPSDDPPIIKQAHFTGTGTRMLEDHGKAAISELFQRSFS